MESNMYNEETYKPVGVLKNNGQLVFECPGCEFKNVRGLDDASLAGTSLDLHFKCYCCKRCDARVIVSMEFDLSDAKIVAAFSKDEPWERLQQKFELIGKRKEKILRAKVYPRASFMTPIVEDGVVNFLCPGCKTLNSKLMINQAEEGKEAGWRLICLCKKCEARVMMHADNGMSNVRILFAFSKDMPFDLFVKMTDVDEVEGFEEEE
ncbi:hypothetical protein FACS189472_11180 [Alphaproteobacteria bacterium]|nr:hypothetical protein FACS189472_11180 [Alphaproteobacteria bacterium]